MVTNTLCTHIKIFGGGVNHYPEGNRVTTVEKQSLHDKIVLVAICLLLIRRCKWELGALPCPLKKPQHRPKGAINQDSWDLRIL